jgi:hypothetical protein
MFSFRDRHSTYTIPTENRIYLSVSYDDKNEAKQLGAKWDKDKKQWYAPNGEPKLVERWGEHARILTVFDGEDRNYGGNTLCVEFQPKSSWCRKVQYAIQRIDRERVQDFVLGRTNRTCESCGVQNVERDFHMHGRWIYENGTQKLVRLMALCEKCYESTHLGTAHHNGRRNEALSHFKTVTKKTDAECQAHVDSAYQVLEELNKQAWEVDLSLLKNNGIQCESASRVRSFFSKTDTSRVSGGTNDNNGIKKTYPKKMVDVEHRAHCTGKGTYSFR